jgi:hypothetical protein
MTAHTGEFPTMAYGTRAPFSPERAFRVTVEEGFAPMGFRFEGRAPGVAILASPWSNDPWMAHEAIGHFRQSSRRDAIGLLQAAVACLTGVLRVEVLTDIGGGLEVRAFVDGAGDERRDAAHLQMHRVAEMHHRDGKGRRPLRGDGGVVAAGTHLLRREEIVGCPGAAGRRSVATDARQAHAEVELMRKRRGPREERRAQNEPEPNDDLHSYFL